MAWARGCARPSVRFASISRTGRRPSRCECTFLWGFRFDLAANAGRTHAGTDGGADAGAAKAALAARTPALFSRGGGIDRGRRLLAVDAKRTRRAARARG